MYEIIITHKLWVHSYLLYFIEVYFINTHKTYFTYNNR